MAASKLYLYDSFSEHLSSGVINLLTDTIKVALFASTSNCTTLTLDQFSELTNEIAAANGYPAGGVTLANQTVTETAGTTTFDGDDFDITATGGSIAARYAVLYSDTAAGDELIGYILLDDTPADLTALDTQHFIIQWAAAGILQLQADNA